MLIKSSTAKQALKNIILTLSKIVKESDDVIKANMTCENSNGQTITRIEIVSRMENG